MSGTGDHFEELELNAENGHIEHQPDMDVNIAQVEVDALAAADSPRISGENPEHVAALAATDAELPPIIVHRPTMRVIDGLHRLRVAKVRGQRRIAVRFFDGDEADAFVLAVRSNVMHGLPLSLADRKRAVERIVGSHPQWSDRMVAAATGTAAGTVADIRRRIAGERAAGDVRIGQDGRVRPINGNEGRRLACELITQDPSLSLRQIARAAGISPETARDVRNRLSRGEDPLLRRNRKERANHGGRAGLAGRLGATIGSAPARDRAAVLERLRVDPALRFTETGRNLLRLLNIHTVRAEEWTKMIDNVPPHCNGLIADLARECAETWAEFAVRVEQKVANTA